MTIDRTHFFDSVRGSLFNGSMAQSQVEGCNTLLDHAEKEGTDDRHLAYILATTFHETAQTMQPIAEYGKGKGKKYGVPAGPYGQVYYGRGYVQLTWYDNYVKQDKKLGLNGELVKNADLAMDPNIAVRILFGGMHDGDFTGVGLHKYITCTDPGTNTTDFYNARRIVNGTDCATQIKGYAEKFVSAISHPQEV